MDKAFATLMLQTIMKTLNPDGAYGGIDLCIKCKERGIDKYTSDSGETVNVCTTCVNNMQEVKWDGAID